MSFADARNFIPTS